MTTRSNRRPLLHFNVFVFLTGLFTVLTLVSLRLVWVLMNRFVDDVIPLGEHSFAAAFFMVLLLLITSTLPLLKRRFGAGKNKKYGWLLTIYLSVQLLIYLGLLAVLYPEVKSMYLEMLPGKLLRNGVLPVSFAMAAGGVYFLNRKLPPPGWEKAFLAVNGAVFLGFSAWVSWP